MLYRPYLGVVLLALATTACSQNFQAALPSANAPAWGAHMPATARAVTGHVALAPGAIGGQVYLADATGTPAPGLYPSSLDAMGSYQIQNVPAGKTYVVIADLRMPGGKSIQLKTLTSTSVEGATADLSAATTAVVDLALKGRKGSLGHFKKASFDKAVAATFGLLSNKGPSPSSNGAILQALAELAAVDTTLAAAITSLQTGLATNTAAIQAANEAIAVLQSNQAATNTALQSLQAAQATTSSQLTALGTTVQGLQATISTELQPQLASLQSQQTALLQSFGTLQSETNAAIATLTTQQAALATLGQSNTDAIAALSVQVSTLSNTVNTLQTTTTAQIQAIQALLTSELALVRGDLSALQAGLTSEIASRQAGDSALSTRIDTLQSSVTTISLASDTLSNSITTLQARVSLLENHHLTGGSRKFVDQIAIGSAAGGHVENSNFILTTHGGPVALTFTGNAALLVVPPFPLAFDIGVAVDGSKFTNPLGHAVADTQRFSVGFTTIVNVPAGTHTFSAVVHNGVFGTRCTGTFSAFEL